MFQTDLGHLKGHFRYFDVVGGIMNHFAVIASEASEETENVQNRPWNGRKRHFGAFSGHSKAFTRLNRARGGFKGIPKDFEAIEC